MFHPVFRKFHVLYLNVYTKACFVFAHVFVAVSEIIDDFIMLLSVTDGTLQHRAASSPSGAKDGLTQILTLFLYFL